MKKIVTYFIFLFCITSFAGVNIKNGNFYISYTDIELNKYQSAFKDITRTYNSKSTYIGMFGYGWGTKLETHLKLYPDGSLSVGEYGAGGTNFFTSQHMTEDLLELMIEELMEVILEQGSIENTPSNIMQEINKLKDNLEYRAKKWDKYVLKGLLEYTTDFPIGMEWESFSYLGNQKITLTEKGYVRNRKSKLETEIFNKNGKLIRYDLGNGVFNTLEYTDNRLSKMTTGDGSIITFELNKGGFISKLLFDKTGREAIFKYDKNNLVFGEDTTWNQYGYKYDENHNLITIVYNPVRLPGIKEDNMRMSYHPKTSYIKSITDREDNTVSYEYPTFYKEDGTIDPHHYATTVTKKGYGDETLTSTYEFYIKVKENGDSYTHKEINTINGIKTIRKYDGFCSQRPVEITRRSDTTYFKYNNRCLLIEKSSPFEGSISMRYHPTSEKITYVKNDEGIYEFIYDEKLNLIIAIKDNEKSVELIYDQKSKITTMINKNTATGKETVLTFKYNKIGKPIQINLKDVGSINVTYDSSGEIERVASDDGHKTSLQVTQAFQSLLQLVKPSGVNLSM